MMLYGVVTDHWREHQNLPCSRQMIPVTPETAAHPHFALHVATITETRSKGLCDRGTGLKPTPAFGQQRSGLLTIRRIHQCTSFGNCCRRIGPTIQHFGHRITKWPPIVV
jgi:hypothetical protein